MDLDNTKLNSFRKPTTNVRHADKVNKMTKLGSTGIHYSDSDILGSGVFAVVYKGFFQSPERPAAVKRVFSRYTDISVSEINIWMQVLAGGPRRENINIVQLFSWTEFPEAGTTNYYFAMELANGDLGTILREMIHERDPNYRSKAHSYLQDSANGLSWLHSKRVIHRDIKPDNILIFCYPEGDIAKLGDFGISKNISGLMETGTTTDPKGTLNWMAPETYHANRHRLPVYKAKYPVDIFSFGMTCHFAIKNAEHPFAYSQSHGYVAQNNIEDPVICPSFIGNNEYTADHLFHWMMTYDPKERPTIGQVLGHPFYWDFQRQVNFLLDVMLITDDKNDEKILTVKGELDRYHQSNQINFDWKAVLGPRLVESLFSKKSHGRNPKKQETKSERYDEDSVCALLKLIRNKHMHQTDLEVVLNEEYFGIRDETGCWSFSDEKYYRFYLGKFPNLVLSLFLFIVQSKVVKKLKVFDGIKWKYNLMNMFHDTIPDMPMYS